MCAVLYETGGVVVVLNPLLLIASWLPLLAALSAILHLSQPPLNFYLQRGIQ